MPPQRDSPLLVDQRRVILDAHSTELWMGRVIAALSAYPVPESVWPSVFSLANTAAYHLSRAGESNIADELLLAQLLRARELVTDGRVEQAAAAFDAQLNRVRLASIRGENNAALDAIESMLTEQADLGEYRDLITPWNDLVVPLTQNDRQALEIERLLIEWRCGVLDADDLKVYLDPDRTYLRPLLLELSWRTMAEQSLGPAFAVEHSDTLKRAMHRFVVWASIYPDSSLGRTAVALLDRASFDLPKINFVCPSTPVRWARCVTALSRLDKQRLHIYQNMSEELNYKAFQEAQRNTTRLLAWSKTAPPKTGNLSELSQILTACLRP